MGNICVFGASSGNIPQSYKEAACEVGALLAENGWGMVFGGGAWVLWALRPRARMREEAV